MLNRQQQGQQPPQQQQVVVQDQQQRRRLVEVRGDMQGCVWGHLLLLQQGRAYIAAQQQQRELLVTLVVVAQQRPWSGSSLSLSRSCHFSRWSSSSSMMQIQAPHLPQPKV